jgi:4a-hydroxytetrahydrobiopterin dehydratase
MPRLLTREEITRQLAELPDWSPSGGAEVDGQPSPSITATFELTDFVAALDFVNQVGHSAEQMNHHPDIDIRWNKVTLELSTHSEGGLTQLDIELAHRISSETGVGSA